MKKIQNREMRMENREMKKPKSKNVSTTKSETGKFFLDTVKKTETGPPPSPLVGFIETMILSNSPTSSYVRTMGHSHGWV